LRAQARQSAPQIKIAAGILIGGMLIIVAITVIWVVLAGLAGDYYSKSKAMFMMMGMMVLIVARQSRATNCWAPCRRVEATTAHDQ